MGKSLYLYIYIYIYIKQLIRKKSSINFRSFKS